MGVLKNNVGRPSNKTIIIRRIFKLLVLLIVIVLAVAVGYLIKDKEEIGTKKDKNDKKEITTNIENATTKKDDTFDISQVTTKSIENDYGGFLENAIEVYVYGNKIDSNKYPTNKIISVTPIEDAAIIELNSDLNILLLVNKKGEIIYDFERDNYYYYCSDNNYSSECYQYKVDGNTIKYVVSDLGQDSYTACVTNYNKDVLKEYEITYKDGKLSKPKKISSVTGKEYVQKHNIDCSE